MVTRGGIQNGNNVGQQQINQGNVPNQNDRRRFRLPIRQQRGQPLNQQQQNIHQDFFAMGRQRQQLAMINRAGADIGNIQQLTQNQGNRQGQQF